MAKRSRVNLKAFFQTGYKPTEVNFADLIDSSLNLEDDGITMNGQDVALSGCITLGDSTNNVGGSIRWDGSQFLGHDGASWNPLGSGTGTTLWENVGATDDIFYNTGRVAIGTTNAPQFMLDVAPDSDEVVRLGRAVVGGEGDAAKFCHTDRQSSTQFALSQSASGAVTLNTPTTSLPLTFAQAGSGQMYMYQGRLGIGVLPVSSLYQLIITGNAAKPGGGTWASSSDKRLKKDIKEFDDGLDKIKKLNPVQYKYNGKAGMPKNEKFIGLIAQDIKDVCPDMVSSYKAKLNESDSQETELLSLDNSSLIYMVVNALKELDERLQKLEKK